SAACLTPGFWFVLFFRIGQSMIPSSFSSMYYRYPCASDGPSVGALMLDDHSCGTHPVNEPEFLKKNRKKLIEKPVSHGGGHRRVKATIRKRTHFEAAK
ncbi:MAG TPA: hypothetical protein VF141_15015, partial [Chryseolinea sp.]